MAARAGDTSSGGIYPAWPPPCEGHGNTEEACPKCMYVKFEPEEVFKKILTPSDVQQKGSYRLHLVKSPRAKFCLPANGSKVIVYDVQMKPWIMRFRTRRGSAFLTRGWSQFAQAKQLSEGDSITFYELNCKKRTGKRVFMIGASRKECIQILGTPIN